MAADGDMGKIENIRIDIPDYIGHVLSRLKMKGHASYIVGGCLRDSLIGIKPADWDICTSARPDEVGKIFSECRVIKTGLKQGTLTVICTNEPVEITTFRNDRKNGSLKEDLSRRDFTVNSLAYNEETGLIDFFNGIKDLKEGIIRTVGDAGLRFSEDPLRILRAVRFSAQLGFSIEPDTLKAMTIYKSLLKNISIERITAEFCRTLIHGYKSMIALSEHSNIIFEIIPEAERMYGFNQYNPYHNLNVWEHTLKAMSFAGNDLILSLTLFFHDIGKPGSFILDDSGIGHFYGHEKISADLAEKIMARMRFDNKTIEIVKILIKNHQNQLKADKKQVKKLLNKMGEANLKRLIKVRLADIKAQNPERTQDRLLEINDVSILLEEILLENQCFMIKDLAVNGNDLKDIGIPQGKQIGNILNTLLNMVIEERVKNEREELMKLLKMSGAEMTIKSAPAPSIYKSRFDIFT